MAIRKVLQPKFTHQTMDATLAMEPRGDKVIIYIGTLVRKAQVSFCWGFAQVLETGYKEYLRVRAWV